jgi:deoxyribonuclease-4
MYRAAERGAELGCRAIQVFTRNPSQWFSPALTEADIDAYRRAIGATQLESVVAHDSYLINLASSNPQLRQRSMNAMLDEMDRATSLGIGEVVTHLGAHTGAGEEAGLQTLTDSLDAVIDQRPESPVKIALETTAGQGTTLGWRFEQIASVLSKVQNIRRFSVCFDTCHVHVAGYDLLTPEGIEFTWSEFENVIGMEYLGVIHLNDAKKERGSRIDRHEHIGKGQIGVAAFQYILASPKLSSVPKILETPDSETMHSVNLDMLRSLARGPV